MAQLQARYPNASLIAEFVTVHQEHLVVRALVQVGGFPLATGMAAATDIEQAEDRAKIRALAALGIGGFTPSASPQSSAYSSSIAPTSTATTSLPISHLSSPSGLSTTHLALSDASIAATPSEDVPHLSAQPAPGVSNAASDLSTSASGVLDHVSSSQPLPAPNWAQSEATSSPLPVTESPLNLSNSDFSANFAGPDQPEFSAPESFNAEPDRTEYEFSYEPEAQSDHYEPDMNHLALDASSATESGLPSLDSIETTPAISKAASKAASSADPIKAATTGKGKTTKRKAENTEIAPSTAGENDRSEEIAKIGLEMKRLGWTTEQGRNYLKRTYGKRSRQELDDSELIDFLRYLEVQVSPSESPF